jgi:hypothetical protein
VAEHPTPDLGDRDERARIIERARQRGYRSQLGVGIGLGVLGVLAILGSLLALARGFR